MVEFIFSVLPILYESLLSTYMCLSQDADNHPKPLPARNISDIPVHQVEYIVQRMHTGGYGDKENILR